MSTDEAGDRAECGSGENDPARYARDHEGQAAIECEGHGRAGGIARRASRAMT
jgi:hypothetical protein